MAETRITAVIDFVRLYLDGNASTTIIILLESKFRTSLQFAKRQPTRHFLPVAFRQLTLTGTDVYSLTYQERLICTSCLPIHTTCDLENTPSSLTLRMASMVKFVFLSRHCVRAVTASPWRTKEMLRPIMTGGITRLLIAREL